MSAPRDAERVLADVLAELDRLIRQTEAGVTFWEKHVGGEAIDLMPMANLHAAKTGLDLLLAVRRAARGGRDGGGE
jgi:hypothetical protein